MPELRRGLRLIAKLADSDSSCATSSRTSIAKTYGAERSSADIGQDESSSPQLVLHHGRVVIYQRREDQSQALRRIIDGAVGVSGATSLLMTTVIQVTAGMGLRSISIVSNAAIL